MKKLLILLFTLICGLSATFATDYTIPTGSTANSTALPIWMANSAYGSLTQQVYLASELSDAGASAGNITALTFYYTAKTSAAATMTRPIKIWLMETTKDSIVIDEVAWQSGLGYDGLAVFNHNGTNKGGQLVYTGNLSTESCSTSETKTVTINLNSPFLWDGSKNIILTVCDLSETSATISSTNLRFVLVGTSKPRFAHKRWLSGDSDTRTSWFSNLSDLHGEVYGSSGSGKSNQVKVHKYVNKLSFTIEPAAVVIPAPENLAASDITTSSATLTWDEVTGATSYNVRWGKTSGSLDHSDNVTTTSIDISGLDDGETYYFDVQTVKGESTSAFASEENFETTAIAHTHDAITFSKWNSTSSLPTSGNYYLNADVHFESDITLTGDLNLCLNGKTVEPYGAHIIVPDGKTFTLFDNEGGGSIVGPFASHNLPLSGLITVESGGTLVLKEGTIRNTYVTDEDGFSYAIANLGTLKLSGEPVISGGDVDIYLNASCTITLESGKPLTNDAPYKVQIATSSGDFTSGWNTAMGSANPADYFTSANASYGVCRNGNEARLVRALSWSGTVNNSTSISDNNGQLVNVTLASRTITSASYNTLCLPFNLSNDELQEAFGSGYDLEELTGSSLDATTLNLSFTQRTSLVAGKPYLILPSVTAVDPSFVGVTISATTPSSSTSEFADFIGIYNPTELTVDNRNTLFLGASNTLFFPSETANMPGFRGYFSVKGGAQQAIQAVIFPQHTSPTGIENVNQKSEIKNHKYLIDGQLIIIRDGIEYNAQGIRL